MPRDDTTLTIVPPPSNPLGVAREFVIANYHDDRTPRIVHHRGLFYEWATTHWVEAERRAVRAHLYRWLGEAVYEKHESFVPFDPTRTKVANVLEALEAEVHLPDRVEGPAWIDDPELPAGDIVSVKNGLLELSTRSLHPHSPLFYNSYCLPFSFDPEAPAPARWHRFLAELWEDDQESINTLAEVMGYIVAGGTEQQKIFMLVGPKRTGKGTILRVLTALLGQGSVAAPTLSSLSQNFGLQPLVGKPLAAISDARLGSRSDALIAVERLLSISGEDSITIDRKFKDGWTGRLPTRFVLLTNEIPRFTDASGALASRFTILTLTKSFYGREDPGLTDDLLEELAGIFNWALAGLDRLTARGHFVQPQAAASAVRHLEDLASPVSAFVRDRCTVGAGQTVDKEELWAVWKLWVEDEGGRPGTKAVFVRDLRAAVPGATPRRLREGANRRNVIAGLAIGSEEAVDDDHDPRDEDDPRDEAPTPDQNGDGQGWSGVETIVAPVSEDELERLALLGEELGLRDRAVVTALFGVG